MLKDEIVVGGLYTAKISNKLTTVRVDNIREDGLRMRLGGRSTGRATYYDVTNTRTGRKTTFRSAAKFRSRAKFHEEVLAESQAARPTRSFLNDDGQAITLAVHPNFQCPSPQAKAVEEISCRLEYLGHLQESGLVLYRIVHNDGRVVKHMIHLGSIRSFALGYKAAMKIYNVQ